jgi:hypothetical protein
MAVLYDETIIHAGVERLYARANTRIATYTLLGVGIGLSMGYVLAGLLGEVAEGRMPYEALCILLFGGIGYSIGRERAFVLRLRAQTALCQLKIEENTRAASVVSTS